ncbi:hypothetical protein PHAMO_190006 [Magnetospirillum molischianum DSM 120]|uniref:Uncharacterized protein n=1 Tax=Magnetospirillum molischianum DSM 120 TaxID=1150626 RepID=H8FPA9_MAGML|nr:hypothetical protein PHAMO_190006 [Magnetospirillum molischianum DSM 120]
MRDRKEAAETRIVMVRAADPGRPGGIQAGTVGLCPLYIYVFERRECGLGPFQCLGIDCRYHDLSTFSPPDPWRGSCHRLSNTLEPLRRIGE